jgi:hypothetical protein
MLKKSKAVGSDRRPFGVLLLLMLVCLSGWPWSVTLATEGRLKTPGPWPDSSYELGNLKRLPSGKLSVQVWIVAGSKKIDVISLKSMQTTPSPGDDPLLPDPFTLEGAYLENAGTGEKYPLVSPSNQDGYLGSTYTMVQLSPRSSTSMAAVFAPPVAADPEKPPIYRLYLPGAAAPVENVVLPD